MKDVSMDVFVWEESIPWKYLKLFLDIETFEDLLKNACSVFILGCSEGFKSISLDSILYPEGFQYDYYICESLYYNHETGHIIRENDDDYPEHEELIESGYEQYQNVDIFINSEEREIYILSN